MLIEMLTAPEAGCSSRSLSAQVLAPGSLRYAGEVLARCQALANAAQGGSILTDHTSFKVKAALEGRFANASCLPAPGMHKSACSKSSIHKARGIAGTACSTSAAHLQLQCHACPVVTAIASHCQVQNVHNAVFCSDKQGPMQHHAENFQNKSVS